MIDDHLPPPDLRRALDGATSEVKLAELRQAAHRLSASYRGGRNARCPEPPWTDVDRLAYAGARMPATYRAALVVLQELRARCPDLRVVSLLDIGSGPATSLWAVGSVFDELSRATLVEPDPGMVALGQRLLVGSALAARVDTAWHTGPADHLPRDRSHDLVMAGYLLGELGEDRQAAVVDGAWEACGGAVVFIEPGSVEGYRRVIDARRRLLDLGARVVAPCPHERPCPLPSDDWCHFSARLNRTSLQRQLKGGALAYEDEKYAFVAATRESGAPSSARVIQRPRLGRGHVTLNVCAHDGLRAITVTRSHRDDYRRARKVRWGDSWD